jgi:hypothetical protein
MICRLVWPRLTSSRSIIRSLASKPRPTVQVQLEDFTNCHDFLHKVLTQNVGVALPWASLTSSLIESLPMRENDMSVPVKAHNVDTFVLAVCSEVRASKALLDYIEFMKVEGKTISIAAYEYIFSCWGKNVDHLSDKDLAVVVQHCDFILENPKSLPVLKSYAIAALANAGDYQRAFNLLQKQNTHTTQDSVTVRNVALKALKDNDMDLFWMVVCLDHIKLDGLSLLNTESGIIMEMQDSIFEFYIEKKCNNNAQSLDEIFRFMGEVGYLMRPSVTAALFQHRKFKKVKLSTTRGSCPKCKESLEQRLVSSQECKTLFKILVDKVVYKDDNVYGGSSPKEFKAFIRKLKSIPETVDIVVDGLNLSLVRQRGVKFKSHAQQSEDVRLIFFSNFQPSTF